MSKFDGNVRTTKPLNDDELRESLKGGWNPELPAIKDEHGVLIVGHRRVKVAEGLGVEPVIKTVTFGDGPDGEAARIRLANVSNIGGAPMTAEDRKAQAVRLYDGGKGLTMDQIAPMLGVSEPTIHRDLKDVLTDERTPKREPKTDSLGRKNSGRPKAAPKPKPAPAPRARKNSDTAERRAAELVLDGGKSYKQAAAEAGLNGTEQVVKTAVAREEGRREAKADPVIDPATLSIPMRKKFDAAIRQYKKTLAAQFEKTVQDEIQSRLRETVLPLLDEQYRKYLQISNSHQGLMPRATYRLILSCLHPDSRRSASKERLAEAMNAFASRETVLSKREVVSSAPLVSSDLMDWDAAKKRATEARRAKRASGPTSVRRA